MSWKLLNFDTWHEYKSSVTRQIVSAQEEGRKKAGHGLEDIRYVYRGQATSSWGLEATFDRHVRDLSIGASDKPVYDQFIAGYIQRGLEYEILDDIGLPESEKNFYFEAMARHHGLPTRLLDWTYSPYIAAFFAFTEHRACEDGQVSIWCLDVENAKICFHSGSAIEIKERPKKGNFRQLSQQGLYTRNISNQSRIEDYFDESKGRFDNTPKYPILFKCNIPVNEYINALSDLEYMGISSLTMYNDMEGLVKYHSNELIIHPDRFK